uniref:HECT-type E3 ubiquitin transferase n=1 Tax=Kwoniella dejecticola CBS 10117 TaxID=1296121 RepID=A0A1A6ABX4_9TREE|nr:ubiquitin-protein ligase E3 C [Kwoniella dejecticola CBS 10117]OBR87559.1 ubiquitin-protein ligase E3 C [Kwoniella dejecticola CBS 10117]
MFNPNFSSGSRHRNNDINLSTSQSTSSSALLSNIRNERNQREQKRREEIAALRIQKTWRGRRVNKRFREDLIDQLKGSNDIEVLGRGLVVLLRNGWGSNRVAIHAITTQFCELGLNKDGGTYRFLRPLNNHSDWSIALGSISIRVLELIDLEPLAPTVSTCLSFLEAVLDSKTYAQLSDGLRTDTQSSILGIVQSRRWVETIVKAMENLIAKNLPKKKQPFLTPLTRLLTAPMALSVDLTGSPLIPPLINHLLAIPSLPSTLPIPALTYLSTNLNLFNLLLPYASQNPGVLSEGRLKTEVGKTCFLGNLATFGITGGMLSRFGVEGISSWMNVIGKVLSGVDEGWGKWVDGLDDDDDEPMPLVMDSDDEENEDPSPLPPARARAKTKPRRQTLPSSIASKLTVLATPQHLSTLSSQVISPSSNAPPTILQDFATFYVGLLSAFKGSPKWEGILDALLEGDRGKGLTKRIWREGVRGRWTESSDPESWDTLKLNPQTPPLILLTYMYNHYLLLTPDDEFFSTTSNALSTDEILELAGIWRDLAFWGYMNGVADPATKATSGAGSQMQNRGNEEVRGLFTRGVTRVVERNARRHFADPDFWVMKSQLDLKGFVEAAVYEDAELAQSNDVDTEMADSSTLPRWARARQKFTKRQLAYISPRLGLLNNLPMSVPFQTRLEVFRKFIESDQQRLGIDYHSRRQRNYAKIRRTHISQDGFDELGELGPALKSRIEITFVDQYGLTEAGIDGGGLFKEFLTNLSKEVFDTNRGLWLATDQNELYPNPHSYATESHQLAWYRFIGQILGKAMYEGMLVDVSFAGFFLAKWLGRQSYLDDLNSLDKDLYKGLIILKNYPKPEELALNFAMTEDDFGVKRNIDLIHNGSEVAVTAENRHEYIQLVCKYKLDRQIYAQSRAFFNGLSDLIDPKWLRMFDQQELQQLIGGEETLIDIDDLRAHCHVDGFPNDITPRLFWKVVKGFSHEERRALLRFVTSCSRPPLLGFGYLYPKFGVKFNGPDLDRLPTASACFNLLKLPGYTLQPPRHRPVAALLELTPTS